MQAFREEEFSGKFDYRLWLKILVHILPQKKRLILLSGVMVVIALTDTSFPLMLRYAVDKMIIPRSLDNIWAFSAIYFVLVALQFLLVYLLIDITGRVETGMNYDLRVDCFKKLQAMDFSYFDRTPVGWLVARLSSDISRLGDLVAWGIVDTVWGVAVLLFIMIVVFSISWKLALILLALIPIIAWISLHFQVKMHNNFRRVRRLNSMITSGFGEGIHGAKTTKTLVLEEDNLASFSSLTQDMYASSVKAANASALFMPLVLMVSSFGTGLILWRGGAYVLSGSIGFGTMVAFINYTMQMWEPLSNVAHIFAELQHAQAAAERVYSLLELKPEIISRVEYSAAWQAKRMQGEISIQDISFAYKKGQQVFQDFSLEIEAGESIALVGETGTGKTTLVNLICRFYEPGSGKILIDGEDYKDIPISWIHSQLGYVQQVPHLFQGTVMENIRYGRLDATDSEVMDAARLVKADDFIQKLPGTYSYQVGEAGNLLSTGQKQLIAFARVVLANPALLILDEATASIDTETEMLVQEAINTVLKGRTGIIVAHRLSTIRKVDRILMMHKGQILEMGSHSELMALKGRYYQLYMNQFLREANVWEIAGA